MYNKCMKWHRIFKINKVTKAHKVNLVRKSLFLELRQWEELGKLVKPRESRSELVRKAIDMLLEAQPKG
jgi:hypothetical protein